MKAQLIFLVFAVASASALPQYIYSSCETIRFVDRKTWRAPTTVNHTSLQLPVHHVFFHHTDMAFCNTTESCSAEMRNIYELHTSAPREWEDIGYNFLIGGDAKVYVGRNWDAVGAHTLGMNTQSVAFSFMGDYMKNPPSEAMLETAKRLITCGMEQGYVSIDYQLHGHRDQSCTDCPGDMFYSLIKKWPHFVAGPLESYICRNP